MENVTKKIISISVKNLVEYGFQKGDLRTGLFLSSSRAVLGTKIHQKIQNSRNEFYEPEVTVKYLFSVNDFEIMVQGRIDGIFNDDESKPIIEEIKTTVKDLAYLNNNPNILHIAQLKFYSYIIAKQNAISSSLHLIDIILFSLSTKNKVTWILTTNNYMKLIDPIRTRGPRIDFLPQKQKIRKLLTNICKERGIKLSDRDILKIIDNTQPNFREAINCIIVPGKQTNYTEIRNDLIKLYNKELTVKDFERKHSGLSFDSIITIINSMSEKDIDDFPYIVMFAWKTATYSNMLSKKALLYFINNVKDNNFCKDMIKEIV